MKNTLAYTTEKFVILNLFSLTLSIKVGFTYLLER